MDIPRHLAIIMDGNGRWAQNRMRPRVHGHIKGSRVAKTIIHECSQLGLKYLTLYAFSSENWFRPKTEVEALFKILKKYLQRETQNLIKENIKVTFIGDLSRMPLEVRDQINHSVIATEKCTGLNVIFATSYGGRQEITQAVKEIAEDIVKGRLAVDKIDESLIEKYLFTHGIPDPDLILRTSGEQRISNFLLWQCAYSELMFIPKLWPDITIEDIKLAFGEFFRRQRRFGRVETQNEELHH